MKANLKILFVDFTIDFDAENSLFVDLLKENYNVEFSKTPDLLFYSNYGKENLNYRCAKIFYSSENILPDFRLCDFSLSFSHNNYKGKNYRLPLFVKHTDLGLLTKPKDIDQIIRDKKKFCNFIYSNARAIERIEFFKLLAKYKQIDSPGSVMNNMKNTFERTKYDYKAKVAFMSTYKFSMAFENESADGYTTEKIIHPMMVNSLPIYWGNSLVNLDFNTKSFINVMDYPSFQEAIEHIIAIDSDISLYRKYLEQPFFKDNKVPEEFTKKEIGRFLNGAVKELLTKQPVSASMENKLYARLQQIKYFKKKVKYKGKQILGLLDKG